MPRPPEYWERRGTRCVCGGGCRHKSPEECAHSTHLVFPHRGVFVRHLDRSEAVAEPNQVLIFNPLEGYRISHPVSGGDGCLSLSIGEDWLRELVPTEYLRPGAVLAFGKQHLGIDPRAQALVATLRHSLRAQTATGIFCTPWNPGGRQC